MLVLLLLLLLFTLTGCLAFNLDRLNEIGSKTAVTSGIRFDFYFYCIIKRARTTRCLPGTLKDNTI